MKKWLWVGGWGLSPQWQQEQAAVQWPQVQHEVLPPTPAALRQVCADVQESVPDRLLGYSLGTLLLMRELQPWPDLPITLLAPILDFKAEAGCGGRVSARRLRILLRWLGRDPLAALLDFGQQAGMPPPPPGPLELPYPVEDLIWGIEYLRGHSAAPPTGSHVEALVGSADALLDATRLGELWPQLKVVTGAGHDLCQLLPEVSR